MSSKRQEKNKQIIHSLSFLIIGTLFQKKKTEKRAILSGETEEAYREEEDVKEIVRDVLNELNKTKNKTSFLEFPLHFHYKNMIERRSCDLIIPAYLAKKYDLSNRNNQVGLYVVLTEEEDDIFIKKLIL